MRRPIHFSADLLRGSMVALLFGSLLAWATLPWSRADRRVAGSGTIVVYGASNFEPAINGELVDAFRSRWQAESGERIEVITAFGGSGTVTNQILLGAPADVAILASEQDARRLTRAGLVSPGSRRTLPYGGVLTRSPIVLFVRPGNPLGFRGFDDLARPGVRVIHPDPSTSGAASWALFAEWGSAFDGRPGAESRGRAVVSGLWRNVVAQVGSARAARTQFASGFGDVLVTYEQELVYDRARGRLAGEIVHPPRTILAESTVVRLDRSRRRTRSNRNAVDAFLRFLWSDAAQEIFARRGFRPVGAPASARPAGSGEFLVEEIGGWERAASRVVDGLWARDILPDLER